MCRIAGIIDSSKSPQQLQARVNDMCQSMAHGGPDGQGILPIEPHIVLGHRRLALIDLSETGHQPMQFRHLSISFNGEIYNYQHIKNKLIAEGFEFKSQSDTEVILIGFYAWGAQLFKQLEGMFAFALHNQLSGQTYLVRDQAGVKPLYYSIQNNCLVFASEVKAFKASGYTYKENPNWKAYFLAFGHIPHPFTTFEEILSLPAGSYLNWNLESAKATLQSFKTLDLEKNILKENQATAAVQQQLTQAVKAHLIADAPIGVFLSGGIDSSILTLLAHEEVGNNLNTLSINFSESAFSEAKYQQIIVDQIQTKHQSYQVKEADFEKHFDEILLAMDQPSNDGVNSWFVNKCAKENGLKAVLSGIGADELLGGYPSFTRIEIMAKLKKLPKFLLHLATYIPIDKFKKIYFLSYKNPIGEYLFLRGFYTPQTIANLLDCKRSQIDQLIESYPLEEDISHLTGAERISWMETHIFMKNQLLKDTDYMSMAHGIEVRVPFLDQEFLKTLAQIDNNIRFPEQPKGLLINAFKNILPTAIWDRPKMGFSFPLQKWFLKNKRINQPTLYQHNKTAQQLIKKFNAGQLHWSKAFALFQVFNKRLPN